MSAIMSAFTTVLFAVPFLFAVYLKRTNRLNDRSLLVLLIGAGFILRLIYISYTNGGVRQHDVHGFSEINKGHGGYILYLVENHKFPEIVLNDFSQYYHPPLHHIICAVILSIIKFFGGDYKQLAPDVLQVLTALYSTLFCLFAGMTMRLLGLKEKALGISLSAVVFHPTLIILSGSLNNDMLSSLFVMMSIYFTVRWAKNQKFLDIIFIAFSIGLGMFTKLTVGLIAPAVAAVFLVILIKNRKNFKKLILQFVTFGIICIPIGLFWSIRNFVKYDIPLGYVPALSENSGQYIDKSPLKRFFDFSLYQISSPFTQWEWDGANYNEFNPVIALMKNAMFDEETFFKNSISLQSFCTALFFVGAITAVLSVVAIVFLFIKEDRISLELKLLLSIAFAVVFGNYLIFCVNYPQVCTENMRYCVPLIFSGATALGFMMSREKTPVPIISKISSYSMTAMSGFSAFVYIAMMYYSFALE